jgi:hypothetical protein
MEALRSSKALFLKVLCILLLGMVAALGFWRLAPAQKALADGGGLPTRTPTRTLIPFLPTVTPTSPDDLLLVFPPTATSTLEAMLLGEQALPPAEVAATTRPFSLLSCWPFAVVILLLLVVGVMYISNRRQSAP